MNHPVPLCQWPSYDQVSDLKNLYMGKGNFNTTLAEFPAELKGLRQVAAELLDSLFPSTFHWDL